MVSLRAVFDLLFFRRLLSCGLLVLGLLGAASAAPNPAAAPRTLPADRATPVRLRVPNPARLQELRAQREFRYVETRVAQNGFEALWQRFWQWISDLLDTRPGKIVWDYGLYAVMLGALVFAVLKLLQVDLTRAFGRAPVRAPLAYDAAPEDIHGLDFDALLRQAEEQHNYRLAVRLGYLHVLKQLADQSLIRWQPDKTNHDYLYELPPDGPLPDAFRELTRQFDYVWYGEHDDLSPEHYRQARATREAFQQLLSATARRAA